MKVWLAGILVLVATLGGAYFGTQYKLKQSAAAAAEPAKVDSIAGQPVTVPVVTAGAIEGYILARFIYNVDRSKVTQAPAALESLLHDEAFRSVYGMEAARYKKPRKADLDEISKTLVAGINKRLKADAVQDILIEDFSFIPKEKIRSGTKR